MCPTREAQVDGMPSQDHDLLFQRQETICINTLHCSNIGAIFVNKAPNDVNYLCIILEITLVAGI